MPTATDEDTSKGTSSNQGGTFDYLRGALDINGGLTGGGPPEPEEEEDQGDDNDLRPKKEKKKEEKKDEDDGDDDKSKKGKKEEKDQGEKTGKEGEKPTEPSEPKTGEGPGGGPREPSEPGAGEGPGEGPTEGAGKGPGEGTEPSEPGVGEGPGEGPTEGAGKGPGEGTEPSEPTSGEGPGEGAGPSENLPEGEGTPGTTSGEPTPGGETPVGEGPTGGPGTGTSGDAVGKEGANEAGNVASKGGGKAVADGAGNVASKGTGQVANTGAGGVGTGAVEGGVAETGAATIGTGAVEGGTAVVGTAAAVEGGAGAVLTPETGGISLAVAAILEVLNAIIALAIKFKDQLKDLFKKSVMLQAGFLILITLVLNMFISGGLWGAIQGDGGKSGLTQTAAGSSETKALLAALKQNAKSNVSLAGLGLPGIPGLPTGGIGTGTTGGTSGGTGGITSSGEQPGQLKNSYGFSILKFKRVQFENKRDTEFLDNIAKQGYDPRNNAGLDKRIINSLIYLTNRHSFINVRNIVSKYEEMPIDTENSSKPQVMANISAHVSGQAMDIDQIDFIYQGMDPFSCTVDPEDPRRDIVWFNDRSQELYRQNCKGFLFKPYLGGPIIRGISTTAIPIEVAWQDDPPGKSGSMAGTLRGSAERMLEQTIKLPPGSLDKSNGNNPLTQIGFSEIAQQIGIDPSRVTGNTSSELFGNIGLGSLEDQLGLSIGSLKGANIKDIITQTGQSSIEEALNLPTGSWKGNDISSVAQAIGKGMIEKEFGLANGTLDNPKQAQALLAQELLKDSDIEKIATSMSLPKDQISQIINSVTQGSLDTNALISIGATRLDRSLKINDGTIGTYIQAVQNNKPGIFNTGMQDLGTMLDFDKIKMNVGGKELNIGQDQLINLISKLGKGENVESTIQLVGGEKIDNAFSLGTGTTESFVQRGDGDPLDQIAVNDNSLIRDAATALFSNQLDTFAEEYGQSFLRDKLSSGPRNLSVSIDENTISDIFSNPMKAAQTLGAAVLQSNLGANSTDAANLDGGDIRDVTSVSDYLTDEFTWSDSDIGVVPSSDLLSLPSVMSKISSKYGLTANDYQNFVQGDFENISVIQNEIAKISGVNISDVTKLELKDLKNITFVQDALKTSLKWDDNKISQTANSTLITMPIVQSIVQSKFKLSTDDWQKYVPGGLIDTNMFQQISTAKIGINSLDAIKIKSGLAKDIPVIGNLIKGTKLDLTDLSFLKQGNIKAMPSVQNMLKTKYSLSSDDLSKLMSGNITGITKVQDAISAKYNLPAGDINKLLSGDFKNLQVARDVITDKYGVSGQDIDRLLSGDIAHTDFVKSQLAGQLNLPAGEVSKLLDSNFKDMSVLQDMAMAKVGISKANIDAIMQGDIGGISELTKSLTAKGILKAPEIDSIVKGDWLGVDLIKTDFAGKLNMDISDIDVLKLGQINNLPIIQNIALDKFGLDFGGLSSLTSGAWGELDVFKSGIMSKMNMNGLDFQNILAGNIPNLSSITDVFKGQFNLSQFDLQGLTGKMNLAGISNLNSIGSSLGLPSGGFANILGGMGSPASMLSIGGSLGGFGLGSFGNDEAEIMAKVKRPEAQYKVHKVIEELLDMPEKLQEPSLLVIQLITFSQPRDVDPFEPKLEKLYGKSIKNGGNRANNYGLFSMPEAHPNIHIGF